MGCPVFLTPYRLAAILFDRGYQVLLKCVKEGVEFEITVQESRGFGVRALQGCVLAEKTLGALLFDEMLRRVCTPANLSSVNRSTQNQEGRRQGRAELNVSDQFSLIPESARQRHLW